MAEEDDEEVYEELGIRKYPEEVPVETKKEQSSIRPTTLELEVNLPGDTGVEAIVMQDITGDGEPDNKQSVETEDGQNTYELSGFELHGYQVWTKFLLKSHDGVNSPSISSYELRGDKPQ
jgi:hypothetical protein